MAIPIDLLELVIDCQGIIGAVRETIRESIIQYAVRAANATTPGEYARERARAQAIIDFAADLAPRLSEDGTDNTDADLEALYHLWYEKAKEGSVFR